MIQVVLDGCLDFGVQLSQYHVSPTAGVFADIVTFVREAYLILYYARRFILIDTLFVNSGNLRKKANSPTDAKKYKTESEVYYEFLLTELPTEEALALINQVN
jgi:hypothetical protein